MMQEQPHEGKVNTLSGDTKKIVVGVFRDRVKAESALSELHAAGFSEEDTGFVIRGKKDPGDDESPVENDSELEKENTGGGVLAGGTIGGVLGAAATGLIPGVGPIIAAGALAGVLGGAAAGGVAGGVIGTLTGIGVPEDEAKIYEDEFKKGHPIITVKPNGRGAEAWQIMERNGAYDAHTRAKE
jgi:hypothetical protein